MMEGLRATQASQLQMHGGHKQLRTAKVNVRGRGGGREVGEGKQGLGTLCVKLQNLNSGCNLRITTEGL